MKKIKIVYTLSQIAYGGAETSLLDICQFINKSIFDITLISILEGDSLEKKFENIPNLSIITLNYKNRLNPLIIPKLIMLFNKIKPDIIHTNLHVANTYSRLAGFFFKAKLITTAHTVIYKNNFFYKIEKITSLLNTKIIANSEFTKKFLIRNNYISENKIEIIPLGVNFNKLKKTSLTKNIFLKKYNLPINAKIITHIGSFKKEKGHQFLLDAIGKLIQANPDFYFFLVGKGSLLEDIKLTSKKLGINDNVIFTGNLNNVSDILTFSDLFVNTSIAESFGVAIIEAMYFKVPVIAFNVDAIPEIVLDDVRGVLVDMCDVLSLATKIQEILIMKELPDNNVSKMVVQAYEYVSKEFTIENTVSKLEDFYIKILGG